MTADLMDVLAAPLALPSRDSAHYREDAPGAVLDGQPWARTWATFLRAVNDPRDSSARQLIANAMTERIPAEGGFLVPEILRSQVMAYMTPAIMRPRAMVLPMSSLRLPIPVLDNPSQASGAQALGGLTFAFAEEGAAIASSTPAFGRVILEAAKLAALIAAPNELADDAAGAFGDFLARVIAIGLAWAEDDSFIGTSGTGTGRPQSVINAPCAVAVTRNTSNQVLFLDVVAMFKALHPASKQMGLTSGVTSVAWLLSASAMDQLLELNYQVTVAAVTTPIPPSGWFTMGDGDRIGPSMLGLPAIVTDHQPALGTAGDVVLADLGKYVIGDRLAMTVERSQESSGFITDVSNFRIRTRLDGRYWIQSASTTEANQQVSPVVVLH
jgi:HK97 family phage major capsid protein